MSRKPKLDGEKPQAPKPTKLQSARGMRDLLPNEHDYFTIVKKVVRHRARQAGFRRISTPVLEDPSLFLRSVGDGTDIVDKELFALKTEGGTELVLKPEGTAGVVRAYLEHGMASLPQPVELYYIEPHFRHDRPQKGRYRQFSQFGFEVIGEHDPAIDAQLIQIAWHVFADLKIADKLSLQINTIGSSQDRQNYIEALKDYYTGKERNLCETCKTRLTKNPLRLLDCKEEDCRILAGIAPKVVNHISAEAKDYYAKVKELLTSVGITFTENPSLVRGLDYYTDIVFEVWDASTGAQNAVGGGGRYDVLVEQLGGAPTPACGFAVGIDRVVARMQEAGLEVPNKDHVQVFVAQLGWEAKKEAMKILSRLRELGVHTLGALGTASMKNQLSKADRFGVDYAVIIGEVEVREGRAIIRDMKAGKQEILSLESVVDEVVRKIGQKNLDRYDPANDITQRKKDPAEELLITEDN
jgi:histidyl-tRNA synthetase